MNAYELAEQAESLAYEIPADWSSGKPKNVATDIANMLRQQADRIAELEKDLALKTRDRDVFRDFTLAYEKRIEELEKDLKKVQWALAQHVDILGEMGWHQVNKDGYTTPQTKPLTNDEIREIGAECELKNNGILNWIDFARAIEERHGIK